MLGLYLHFPFCTRRCDYCDFYVVIGREEARSAFVDGLVREIRAARDLLTEDERAADTIYIGGGTPSLMAAADLLRLVAACRETFHVTADAEVTLEANPEGIDRERLDGCLAAGVNRLSIGVQTLDDEGLRQRGRLHGGERALDSIGLARQAGFANINADLIAGLPIAVRPAARADGAREETDEFAESFRLELRRVLERRPDHLSVYLLETDKETPLMRAVRDGRERLPEDDSVAAAFTAAVAETRAAGFEHYEIANFALPGRRSRHNLKYWTAEPYLGFGPAAHSYFRGRRLSSPRDLEAWLAAAPPRGGAEDYTLATSESAAREALVLHLRLIEGVDLDRFDRRWGVDSRSWVRRDAADALEAGLILLDGATLKLSARGVLLANEVFSRLTSA